MENSHNISINKIKSLEAFQESKGLLTLDCLQWMCNKNALRNK